jgi:hypothetical protein
MGKEMRPVTRAAWLFVTALAAALALFVLFASTARAQESKTDPKVDVTEVAEGSGTEVASGDRVTVVFTATGAHGRVVDSSTARSANEPFKFIVGLGQVVRGLDDSVVGMKAGGRRRLAVPAALAYGAKGSVSPQVAPNEALVYDVELVAIEVPPKPPDAPQPRDLTIESASFRVKLTSEGGGVTQLQYRFRGGWSSVLAFSTREWLGFVVDNALVTFVECAKDKHGQWAAVQHPQALVRADLPGQAPPPVTLCSWQKSVAAFGEWNPVIGALTVTYAPSESPPRLDVQVSADPKLWYDAVAGRTQPGYTGPPAKEKPTLDLSFDSWVTTKDKSGSIPALKVFNCVEMNDADVCTSPIAFLSMTSATGSVKVVPDAKSAVTLYMGLRSDPYAAHVPGSERIIEEPLVRGSARVMGFFAARIGSEASLALIGFAAALIARLVTARGRVRALRERDPVAWATDGSGSRFFRSFTVLAIALFTLVIYRSDARLLLHSRMFAPDILGRGEFPTELAVVAAAMAVVWAFIREPTLPFSFGDYFGMIARAIVVSGLAVLGAVGGSWILLPAATILGYALVDMGLRVLIGKTPFLLSAEAMRARLERDIRTAKDAQAWSALGKRADDALRHAKKTPLTQRERVCFTAALAMAGRKSRALDQLRGVQLGALAEDDLPLAAIVLAASGKITDSAKMIYEAVFSRAPAQPEIERGLRAKMEAAFTPDASAAQLADIAAAAATTRPDWAWTREVRAAKLLADGRGEEGSAALAEIAKDNPVALEARAPQVAATILALGAPAAFIDDVAERARDGAIEKRRAYLTLVDAIVALGSPATRGAAARLAAIATPDAPVTTHIAAARVAVAAGDAHAALALIEAAMPALEDGTAEQARELAWLRVRATLRAGTAEQIAELHRASGAKLGPEALTELALAIGDSRELRAALPALSRRATNAPLRILLARAHLALGEPSEAMGALEGVPDASPTRALLAARAAMATGQLDSATSEIARLAEAFPFWSEALFRLGCAKAHAGDLEAAARELEGAANAGEACAAATCAEVMRRDGKAASCATWLARAIERGGDDPRVLREAAAVAIATKDPKRARAAVARLQIAFGNPDAIALLEGALLESEGDSDGARAIYERTKAWGQLGLLAQRRGDRAAAEESFAKVPLRELEQQQSAALLHGVAAAAVRAADLARADRALSLVLALRRDDTTVRRELAAVRIARARVLVEGGVRADVAHARDILDDAFARTNDARVARELAVIVENTARRALSAGSPRDVEDARRALAELPETEQLRFALLRAALDFAAGDAKGASAGGSSEWARYVAAIARLEGDAQAEARAELAALASSSDARVATCAWLACASDAGAGPRAIVAAGLERLATMGATEDTR